MTSNSAQKNYNLGFAAGYAKALRDATQEIYVRKLTWFAFSREVEEKYGELLSAWEQQFVANFIKRGLARPSPSQREIWERIAQRYGMDCPE